MLHNTMGELLFEVPALDATIKTVLCLLRDVLTHYQSLLDLHAASMHDELPDGDFFLC